MKYNFFAADAKCPISVCYEYYKAESNRLVVYNDSPLTMKLAEITLKNSNNNSFLYREDRLEKKSGSLIDFGQKPDSNGKNFTGDLTEVTVKCNAGSYKFTPQEGKTFKLL